MKNTNYPIDELRARIEAYPIDEPGATFPFSAKLAAQQGWSQQFTQRAIAEYKRFIYLCCTSPTGASPSPVVDEVWHLHLTYTTDYWKRFCKETLLQDIHHNPSTGGKEEKTKHENWYRQTIQLYTRSFGAEPPADIWPAPKPTEIKDDPIDIPRRFFSRPTWHWLLLIVVFLLPLTLYGQPSPFRLTGSHFLVFYLALISATFIIISIFIPFFL